MFEFFSIFLPNKLHTEIVSCIAPSHVAMQEEYCQPWWVLLRKGIPGPFGCSSRSIVEFLLNSPFFLCTIALKQRHFATVRGEANFFFLPRDAYRLPAFHFFHPVASGSLVENNILGARDLPQDLKDHQRCTWVFLSQGSSCRSQFSSGGGSPPHLHCAV